MRPGIPCLALHETTTKENRNKTYVLILNKNKNSEYNFLLNPSKTIQL
jgi:hypothetical protein